MDRIIRRARRLTRDEGAQSLVEFALLLPILMYVLMGIIQFGLIFNAYVTMANAVREGARSASFYVFDANQSSPSTDTANLNARLQVLLTDMVNARGILNMGTAWNAGTNNFAHTGTWAGSCSYSVSPCLMTNGDVSVTWTKPVSVTANEPRRGYLMQIDAFYHEPIFVPLLDQFLPDDPAHPEGGWFRVPAHFTVVIN